MNRRLVAASVVAAVFGLAACGESASDQAAEVDGESISVDDLERVVRQNDGVVNALGDVTPAPTDAVTDVAAGDSVRAHLTELINDRLRAGFVAAQGGGAAETDDTTEAAEATVASESTTAATTNGSEVTTGTEATPDPLFAEIEARRDEFETAKAAVETPPAAELDALYESGPRQSGLWCGIGAAFASEDSAAAFAAAVRGGAPFDAGTAGSIDPQSALSGAGTTCFTMADLGAIVGDPAPVLDGAVDETVGPLPALGSAFLVFWQAPFADAEAAFVEAFGDAAYADYVAEADVSVNSRYGRWDPATGAVVGLE